MGLCYRALWGSTIGFCELCRILWGSVSYGADPSMPHRSQCWLSSGTSQSSGALMGPPGTAPKKPLCCMFLTPKFPTCSLPHIFDRQVPPQPISYPLRHPTPPVYL